MMKLIVLGSCPANPTQSKFTTSQVLQVNESSYLIDCGESTQIQLRQNKVKFNSIENIFISHLHGDHYFGLPGLISTFNLLGREKPLNIYGPKGLKEIIITIMKLGKTWTNFKLNFRILSSSSSEVIIDNKKFSVTTIPMKHRIYNNGFLFRKKTFQYTLRLNKVLSYGIDKTQYSGIKLGKNGISQSGHVIKNIELVEPLKPDKTYAFCSDTAFNPEIIDQITGCDLLYHESTFLKKHENLASKTSHSTAEQAATIAKKSNAKKLILGHFSNRYKNLDLFIDEAKPIFKNVYLATQNKTFSI